MTRLRVYTLAPKRISATCALWALLSTSPTFLSLDSGLAQAAQPTQKSLRAFASEEELNAWLQTKKSLFEKNRADVEAHSAKNMALPSVVYAPAPVQDSLPQNESVTNNQTAGVDEGGIVKVHKNHLVILRRGRLFTVRITNNTLQPVDMQDAFAPGSSGHAWYDEMLVSDNTVVVIGYSYDKGGTEVILFGIDDGGHLSYYDTYVLRSNDYYSSRNYASRLIGNTLVFYAPLHLHFYRNPLDCFPATLLWQKNEKASFKPIAPATRIYRTTDDLDPTQDNITLHTVMACEISKNKLDCSASAVLGPSGREFYVAKDAVYVWSAPSQHYYGKPAEQMPVAASVFRLPLNTQEAPTALKTYGSPIDQFSFLESTDGYLHVLLRAEGPAPSMWASEQGSHELALLRIPLRDFGDGSTSAPPEHYFPLPSPKGGSSLQNRYIGDYLVYGAGQTWLQTQEKVSGLAYLLKWDNPGQVESITPPHRVDRIEALGKAPLLVGGNEGHLYFSVLDFRTTTPPPPQKNKIPPPAETKQTLKQL
ncbi:MAG: beta-propeller domain-containing protein, partial [Proteobacteria bacterium]|nr:beta-propeller domain-containing protein [Pseudomonadota bacterium]